MKKANLFVIGAITIVLIIATIIGLQQAKGLIVVPPPNVESPKPQNCEDIPQILAVLKGKEGLVSKEWREEHKAFTTLGYTSAENVDFVLFIPPSRMPASLKIIDNEAINAVKRTLDKRGKYEVDPNMIFYEDTCKYGDQVIEKIES